MISYLFVLKVPWESLVALLKTSSQGLLSECSRRSLAGLRETLRRYENPLAVVLAARFLLCWLGLLGQVDTTEHGTCEIAGVC